MMSSRGSVVFGSVLALLAPCARAGADGIIKAGWSAFTSMTGSEKVVAGAGVASTAMTATEAVAGAYQSPSAKWEVTALKAVASSGPAPINGVLKAAVKTGEMGQKEVGGWEKFATSYGQEQVEAGQRLEAIRAQNRVDAAKPIEMSSKEMVAGAGPVPEVLAQLGAWAVDGVEWVASIKPFMSSGGQIDMSSVQPEAVAAPVPPPPAQPPVPKRRPVFEPYEPRRPKPAPPQQAADPAPSETRTLYRCGNGYSYVFQPGCYFASYDEPGKSPGAMLGKAMEAYGK